MFNVTCANITTGLPQLVCSDVYQLALTQVALAATCVSILAMAIPSSKVKKLMVFFATLLCLVNVILHSIWTYFHVTKTNVWPRMVLELFLSVCFGLAFVIILCRLAFNFCVRVYRSCKAGRNLLCTSSLVLETNEGSMLSLPNTYPNIYVTKAGALSYVNGIRAPVKDVHLYFKGQKYLPVPHTDSNVSIYDLVTPKQS